MKYICILLLVISASVYSQNGRQSQIDSIIETHVNELRQVIGNEPTVFIDLKYDFSAKTIAVTSNDLFIDWSIDAKRLKKNKDYFMVQFILKYEGDVLKLEGINFRIKKTSDKAINYINLTNGHSYTISS